MMNVPCLSFKLSQEKMMILTMICIIISCCNLLNFGCLQAYTSNSKQLFFYYVISAGMSNVWKSAYMQILFQMFKIINISLNISFKKSQNQFVCSIQQQCYSTLRRMQLPQPEAQVRFQTKKLCMLRLHSTRNYSIQVYSTVLLFSFSQPYENMKSNKNPPFITSVY